VPFFYADGLPGKDLAEVIFLFPKQMRPFQALILLLNRLNGSLISFLNFQSWKWWPLARLMQAVAVIALNSSASRALRRTIPTSSESSGGKC